MKILTQLRFYVVLVSISFLSLLFVHLKLRDEFFKYQMDSSFVSGGDISKSQTIDSLQNLVDSLHSENYPCQIELNRYQIAYEIFMRKNPKAASQYGDIISNETE